MRPGVTVEEIKRNIKLSVEREKLEKEGFLANYRVFCESVGIDYAGPFGKAGDFVKGVSFP